MFEASTLDEGRKILGKELIHIACVDACVAGETGLAFLREMNEMERRPQIVFLSNPDRPSDTEALLREHQGTVDMLLHRPISPEELVHGLETVVRLRAMETLRQRRSRAGGPATFPEEIRKPISAEEASLRASYGAEVPSLFAEIGRLLTEFRQRDMNDSIPLLEEAQRIAHKVTGTAGTIGYYEVSAAAHAVESWIKETVRLKRMSSLPAGEPSLGSFKLSSIHGPPPEKGPNTSLARVLVLDDDENFLENIASMGRDNLIQVFPARTGPEALRLAASQPLDAAILDVILDGHDNAFDIARRLRSTRRNAELPIGFVSVDASISNRISAVHAGGSVFLDKPIDGDVFAAAIRRLVPVTEAYKPKILVVDDDEDFLASLTHLFEAEGFEIATLTSAENIVRDIENINPEMVLLDVFMERVNGLDACRVLRSVEKWQEIPILIMTVHGNRDILVDCYNAGADDYVEKPVIKEELMARINLRLTRSKMFRERADIDVLTGLPTRRPFIDMLRMRLSESGRFNKPVSLCLLDLDHFKKVNDRFGHLAGDRVLAGVGNLLKSRFRIMDVRGRWGGEEFVVAFYGEEEDTARMIVQRVLDELRNIAFIGDRGEKFHVTFSAGVATYPRAGRTVEELFRNVDEKLYLAKASGRNCIVI